MFSRLYVNEPYYIEVCMTDSEGHPITGLSIGYRIVRLPGTEIESGVLDQCQEVYQKLVRFNNEGQYRIYYHPPEGYPDTIEHVIVEEEKITTISSDLKRALGLLHENIYIDLPDYDENNNLVSARVRIYSNPASVGTSSDVIGTYQITSETIGLGKFTTWKQVSQ